MSIIKKIVNNIYNRLMSTNIDYYLIMFKF